MEMSADLPHLVASGFADAITYDAYRPSYPAASVKEMLKILKISDVPEARILEIGAGTGKLTEQLVAQEMSYQIVAVEPHVHMRQVLKPKTLQRVTILDETAANLDEVENSWADAVVIAQVSNHSPTTGKKLIHDCTGFSLVLLTSHLQTFGICRSVFVGYRFANLEAVKEIHRVLKPHGTLALIWNLENCKSRWHPTISGPHGSKAESFDWTDNSGVEWKSTTAWEDAMRQLLSPQDNNREWQTVFLEQPKPPLFSPLEGKIHEWTIWLT